MAGSNWTIGSYKASYLPNGQEQTIKIRVTTVDGSTFSGKKGRIAVGLIGQTGLSTLICPETGLPFDQHSFTAFIVGGVQLDDAKPFWTTDPPLNEQTYAPIGIGSLTKMTISMRFTVSDFTLRILNSDTGAELFSAPTLCPQWNWSGTHAPIFAYYGAPPGTSGSLYLRDFLSMRPSGSGTSTLFR